MKPVNPKVADYLKQKTSRYDFSDFDEPAKPREYDFSDFDEPTKASEPSLLQTATGKLASGASLGFVDELAGGLEAGGRVVGVKGLGGKINEIGLSNEGPTLDYETLSKAYKGARDSERQSQAEMSKANPLLSGASEIAGSIATIPVSGAASLAGRVGTAAGFGALSGLGTSEAEDMRGMAKDTAVGGVLGGALQYGGEKVIAPAAKKLGNWISDSKPMQKFGKVFAGVDEKATEHYLKNAPAVNNARSMGEIADSVLNKADESSLLNEMRTKVGGLSTDDWQNLGRETTINKSELLSKADDFANSILKGRDGTLTRTQATGADADALRAIGKELDAIKSAYGDALSEADLKSIVQSLQQKAFGSDTYSADKMKQLSGVFNDVLKSGNSTYADSVAKTADATQALKQVRSVFENRTNPENYDKFNKQVKNLMNKDGLSAANQAVNKLEEHTGYNLRKDITDSWTKAQFDKGDTNGSRKTLLGSVVGGTVGSMFGPAGAAVGGAVGAMAGQAADKYAGEVFRKMLNGQIIAADALKTVAPYLGKFAGPLMEAAKRGNKAVSAAHFILQSQNQSYREAIKKLESN
jgi:uncharacterized protein YcfJ